MRDFLMFHKGRDGVHRSRSYSVLISLRRRQKSQNPIRGRIGELFSVKVYNSNFAPHHSTISTTSKKAPFCGFALVALPLLHGNGSRFGQFANFTCLLGQTTSMKTPAKQGRKCFITYRTTIPKAWIRYFRHQDSNPNS
ncbi:hypothetical protein M434DRAFT_149325 [Hypoxylon sp. CO27-5]|nr:hypothetical protein M434DRAFT_149325 [Hypoxylon sp. CO27-5]